MKNSDRPNATKAALPNTDPKSGVELAVPEAKRPFRVVGIGASAGGLEAIEALLGGVPLHSGMAYVIVQHLDPTHSSLMPELLQRITPMPVHEAQEGMRVEPDQVYVIPPNKDLALLDGHLHLTHPNAPQGLRLPIDTFFRSLAQERKGQSVAVILSGMGSDGAQGIRSIKEQLGLVLVQEPASAMFNGMPQSAIETGVVDCVAPVADLSEKLSALLHQLPALPGECEATDKTTQAFLERVVALLRTHTGHDFSLYKKATLLRRIERRMAAHQLTKLSTYVRLIQDMPDELDDLFKDMLIGVTSFFRNPEAWDILKEQLLPLLKERDEGGATLSGLGRRLFHRRRGLHLGHRSPRTRGESDPGGARGLAADLRYGYPKRFHRKGAAGELFKRYSGRDERRAREPLFHPRRGGVSRDQGNSADGGVLYPKYHHGSPVHQN